jgi:hypothetical protein
MFGRLPSRKTSDRWQEQGRFGEQRKRPYNRNGAWHRPKHKLKTAFGPKLNSSGMGVWDFDPAIDRTEVFEWLAAEDFQGCPPAEVTSLKEVASYTADSDIAVEDVREYDCPEYRKPDGRFATRTLGGKGKYSKQAIVFPPYDQDSELNRVFAKDMVTVIKRFGPEGHDMSQYDVVTSEEFLRTLVAFCSGEYQQDRQAVGFHQGRRRDPLSMDIARIGFHPEAPDTVFLGSVQNWFKSGSSERDDNISFLPDFKLEAIGVDTSSGSIPKKRYDMDREKHYRLLEYNLGELRMLVRVPVWARIPEAEADLVEGHGVEFEMARRNRHGELWNRFLPSRLAVMQLSDTAMICRGCMGSHRSLDHVQEVTQVDIALDRPEAPVECGRMLGMAERILSELRDASQLAKETGYEDWPLYVNYKDAELRVLAPTFKEFDQDEHYKKLRESKVKDLAGRLMKATEKAMRNSKPAEEQEFPAARKSKITKL